jgi:ribosomal protein S12 methylthiotransferase accessory factor
LTQLESLRDLVSPRTGIIKTLALRAKSAGEPSVPYICDALLSHFDFRKGSPTERGSCGKGVTEEAAMLGAIGEAVERYCAAQADPTSSFRATLAGVGETAVAPPEFVLFSETQYANGNLGFWRWRPQDEILWESVTELGSNASAWVPAVFVYLQQVSDQPQDFLCMPTSSGFAAGPDIQTATRSALLELFERDAFMLAWLTQGSVVEVELNGVRGIIRDITSAYRRSGTEIRVFTLLTDMPATPIMAIAVSRAGSGPAAVVGLGCETNPLVAVHKALFEICQMYEPLYRRHREGHAGRLDAYYAVKTLEDHAAYFFRQDHLAELDFVLQAPRKVHIGELTDYSGASVGDDLRTFERGIHAAGYRAFLRDLTTPDLQPYPIRVVRALVTQLQPITFGSGMERLGGRRLAERGIPEARLNPCPHPLA